MIRASKLKPYVPPAFVVRALERVVNGLQSLQNRLLPPQVALMNMMIGGFTTQRCAYIAAELGIADHLKDGPRGVDDLAMLTGAQPDALFRVLRALAAGGFFAEMDDGRFKLTRLSAPLASDSAESLRSWIRFAGVDWSWNIWSALPATIANGKSAYENTYGIRFFDWFTAHPDASQLFNAAMSDVSRMANPAIVAGYDFSGIGTLLDIAGGQGSLLSSILLAYPGMKGTLFDLASTIEESRASAILADPALAGRVERCSGDIFTSLPPGHDAYVLKWILHDWDDAEVSRILANCRSAAGRPGKKLLIIEMVVEAGNAPSAAKCMDIIMLATTGGRERTREDYARLLSANGFVLNRVVPTASPYCVIEAISN